MKDLSKLNKVGLTISLIGYIFMLIFILLSKPIPYFVMAIFGTGVLISNFSVLFINKKSKNI